MRRLARRLLTLYSGLSLMLALVAVVLLGLIAIEPIEAPFNRASMWRVGVEHARFVIDNEPQERAADEAAMRADQQWQREGFQGPPPGASEVVAKGWSISLVLPMLSAAALSFAFYWLHCRHQRIRRTREASQQCIHCGYDLRASPVRCPECGTSASPASAVK